MRLDLVGAPRMKFRVIVLFELQGPEYADADAEFAAVFIRYAILEKSKGRAQLEILVAEKL